ncbi:hypothetical protein EYF80_006605 [Liparis tanakae]|uniref:Uncharacterized protein n=1 Tax=Liparis tanakae TaxID=230148 RepID=A0A4Z2IZY8_9TELE|nr:hypothetical protein EYF80_006605 [Liparis tanakae]
MLMLLLELLQLERSDVNHRVRVGFALGGASGDGVRRVRGIGGRILAFTAWGGHKRNITKYHPSRKLCDHKTTCRSEQISAQGNVIRMPRQERPLDLHGHERHRIPQQHGLCLQMYKSYPEGEQMGLMMNVSRVRPVKKSRSGTRGTWVLSSAQWVNGVLISSSSVTIDRKWPEESQTTTDTNPDRAKKWCVASGRSNERNATLEA